MVSLFRLWYQHPFGTRCLVDTVGGDVHHLLVSFRGFFVNIEFVEVLVSTTRVADAELCGSSTGTLWTLR